ncbi:D-2-hydroxyacid dehydrogenase [Neptuniibacter halophilus]|uniref:D-2-hydroxyacid dehydrogenase n=1 Tax=Neptuniibacter halophilus TaxID=651666 RepID=UPI0025745B2F|nr:D-2-hydroxyacid dehydrogenase [Neptuniibacter halophilus]
MRAVILDLKGMENLDLTPLQRELDELVTYPLTRAEDVAGRAAGFDIVITNKTPLTRELLQSLPDLKYICVVATGTNVVDKEAAAELGIPVSNCVAYGVDSVVQHVWSMILALHTNLLNYSRDVAQGEWQRSEQFCFLTHPIVELKGKTLGIIGYGHLGQGVAEIGRAFGMQVLIAQRPGSEQAQSGRVSLDRVLEMSDVLSLHCPLTEDTENLIDAAVLARMKPNAFLINAARGGIVNEADLLAALQAGEIAGAATDVLSEEPPRQGNPLLDQALPNLIVTPHIAWGSAEARTRIIQQTAENIHAFVGGRHIRGV